MIKRIATLIIAELLILGQITPVGAANEVFTQTTWVGGADTVTTAVHPTNETGWTKYYSKGAYITTASAGKVTMISEPFTAVDTTDEDFQKTGSLRENLNVTGGSLVLDSTSEDPFVDNLGSWTSLPEAPRMDYWSAFARVVDPNDGKIYIYALFDNKTFGRYKDETGTWEILADTPKPIGFGCSIAYPPGGGDYIYVLRGAGAKDFWRYSIDNNTWESRKETNYHVGAGGCITAYNSNSIYCVVGNASRKFMVYNITGNTWTDLADVNNANVDRQASLVYPGSGDYIYLSNSTGTSLTRYRVPAPAGWATLSSAPVNISDMCYPGTGNYLYAWTADDWNRGFARLNFTGTPAWENLTATARLPLYPYRGIMYHPGSGNKHKLLSAGNYSRTFNFDTSTSKWDEPAGYALYAAGNGSDMAYDGTYVYATRADNTNTFYRYDPSADVWESRSNTPFNIYYGSSLAVMNGNIYATRGSNSTNFARYDGTSWTNLSSSQPLPASIRYGSQLCTVGNNLYAFRGGDSSGNGTTSFWKYDTSTGWSSVANAPNTVYTGGSLVYPGVADDDGNYFIYATRGYGYRHAWKYCLSSTGGYTADTWYQIADAPFEPSYKTRFLYPGSGDYLYLLGGGNQVFARYKFKGTTNVDTWEMLEPTPFYQTYYAPACIVGNKIYTAYSTDRTLYFYNFDTQKWSERYLDTYPTTYYYGSMVHPGGDIVYMFYGNYTSHIWQYSLSQKRWVGLIRAVYDGTPILFKPGSKATYPGEGNYIYVIEGGNTSRFWRYDYVNNVWAPMAGPTVTDGIARIEIVSGGTGYTGNPTVTITGGGGTGATARAFVTGGSIYAINVIDYGTGYTSEPTVTFTGGNGSGAVATPKLSSTIPVLFYSGSQLAGKGDVLYVCQGRDVSNTDMELSYRFLTYTISTNTWQVSAPLTDLPDLPVYIRDAYELGNKFLHVPAANKVYWTGYEDGFLRVYDTVTKLWSTTSTTTLGTIRARNGSCIYYHPDDNCIYLFSGADYRLFWKYDIAQDTWTALTTHGREMAYAGYDADCFYPGSGDYIYFSDGMLNYLNRYSISTDTWDMPVTLPYLGSYPAICDGPDGDTIYYSAYTNFYKYSISSRLWQSLSTPYNTSGMSWYWDEWCPQLVYFTGDRDSIFTTRGRNRTNFAKYSINSNAWSNCLSPGTFGTGHCLVASPYKIYALMGGSTTTFVSYNPSTPANPWVTETALPNTASAGAAMVYIPAENCIYALRGNNSPNFYKYNISYPGWATLPDAPVNVRGDPYGTTLVYPAVGDYIYMLVGSVYSTIGDTCSMYRFSLSSQTWDTVEPQSTPVPMRVGAQLLYPGKGNYLYAIRGYSYSDLFRYLLFKQGMYTSEIKNIGRNKNYGTVTWTDTGNGSFEFKARTSESMTMSGATDWDAVPVRKKGDLLSDSYPAIKNKNQYFQYRLKFLADDFNKIPTLNDLTINYEKYRTLQELISTPYDTTQLHNRLMKLSWTETLPTGTDIRLQLRTGSDLAGLLSGTFLGPGGTQTFNDDYTTEASYAYGETIELSNGNAILKKMLQDYLYTQRIVLDNSAGTNNYVNSAIKITIDSTNDHFWSNVKSDGSDIRFVDQQGNTLSYNSETGLAKFDYTNKSAEIFVRVLSIPAGAKTTIYLKYGKADAVSASDPTVSGKQLTTSAAYEGGDSGDYNSGTKPVTTYIGLTYDDSVSGYGGSFNSNILTRDVIVLYGRTNADIITALNNGAIVILGTTGYNSLRSYLGVGDLGTYTSRGYTTKYLAYDDGYAFCATETAIVGCDWEHYSAANLQARGLNFRDTICQLPNIGVSGSDLYLGLTMVPVYFSMYLDKTTSPSLSGWEYRHEIEVNSLNGGALTNYQVQVNVTEDYEDFWSRCRSDGFDVRFIDSNNTTILSNYRVSFDYANKTAVYWVKIPSISANTTKKIYLYYGKSDAADVSSFNNTFTKDFGEMGYNVSGVSLDGTSDQKVTVAHSGTVNISAVVTLEANVKYTADTWLPGLGYRQKVTIDNTSGGAMVDAIVRFSVAYAADKMNADYSDLMFVDTDGAKLAYKLVSYDESAAVVNVKVPSIPALSTKDIYMYYGNASAASESDSSSFPTTWGFWGTTIDSTKFAYGGGTVVQNDEVSLTNNSDSWDCYITTRDTFAREAGKTFQAKFKADTGTRAMIGWHDSGTGASYTDLVYAIYFDNGNMRIYEDGSNRVTPATYTPGTWYDIKIVLKTQGATYYYKAANASIWILLYDSSYSTEATLKVGVAHQDQTEKSYTDDWSITGYDFALTTTPAFAAEESQPAIDSTIINKSGAYGMKFTQAGLTGLIGGTAVVSTPNYGAGTFTHMAFVYNGATAKLLVNGLVKASAALTGAIATNSNNIIIGESLKGAIDEVRIWNIARNSGDILENKEKCLSDNISGLRCQLRLNDNTGTLADDTTTYNNNGTLSAGVAWLTSPFGYSNGMPSALYHLDEGVGDPADASGNGNAITLHAEVSWSDTDLTGFSTGKSLNFNVSNTYGSAADSSSLDVTGRLSIETWIRPSDNVGNRVLVVKGDNTQNRWNYKLYQSNDSITFSIYSGGSERSAATPAFIVAGNTYHVVVTFDENTDAVKIYVNNEVKYSGTLAYDMETNNDILRIGKDIQESALSYKGLMDEIRIYRRILTAEEIKRHYEHRMLSQHDPSIYNVYAPPTDDPAIGSYADNNPTIQPVMGVFYTNKNLMQFTELSTKPVNSDIKYQISRDGYWWYWYNGAAWVAVDAGYTQANTATVVNANLGSFQNMSGYEEGDFYYRAFLHSEPSSYKTPCLDNVAITLYNTETYYLDPAGATAINPLHTDADSDRWFQYKAILYSDGEITPILDQVDIEYVKADITVLTPNGAENLSVGDSYDITWTSEAITSGTGLVKLEYSVNSEPYILIAEHVENTGTYPWTVPDAPSINVVVRVSSEDFPAISDTSDAAFNILSLVVTSPNGAEIWEQAKSHNITWTSTGVVPYNVLKIDYSSNNGSTWSTVNAVVPNTGTYAWTIPMVASDQVLVKVFSTHNEAITDTSDAVFSIVPNPAFTITSPAGGEIWVIGEKHNITWVANTRQFNDQVILEYSSDDFLDDIHQITQVGVGTPAGPNNNDDINGTYEWTIPDAVSAAVKVRVRESQVPAGRDTQLAASKISSAFSIVEPSITVTAPVASDVFVAGDVHNITWTTIGSISNDLLLEYSLDGGENYTQIATGEANDGTYAWTIPAEAFADSVLVRITDNQRNQISGVSAAFKILEYPLIEIIQPNGAEQLTIGTTYQIKWQTFGQKLDPGGSDYNKVSIYYSTNNGVDWTVIAYQSANTKTYNWQVPDEESEQCFIKIVDEADIRVTATSAAAFTIVLPVINITNPIGGEIWFATGSYNITWTSAGSVSNNLLIEYSLNNGGSWSTVASGVANTGSYDWTSVADAETTQALIRITDSNRPQVFDVIDATFSIAPPTITLTFPNGNEELAIGTMQEVTWTSNGYEYGAIRDKLTLQYSTNGGTNWTTIDVNQANDGSYMWVVPDALSQNCLVKIFDADRPATVDTSDAAFKIVLPYVRITAPNGNESWPIGTKKFITWTSVGSISNNLTLQYSKDNFSTHTTIATGYSNTGSYEWTIPNDYSTSAKVKLIDGDRTEIFDISDAAFIIAYPIITITAPNGGELWTAGDQENITWNNTGSVGANLKIEYSKDNFLSEAILVSDTVPNSGGTCSYLWTIPTDISATVRVRVTDTARTQTWDKSDLSFTILPRPEITIDSPNGAEEWRVGSQHEILWHDNGGRISNNLTIQYSTDGGTVWKPIATSVSNTGTYTWTIPDDLSVTCLVKIFDANRLATNDESNDAFKIVQPLITITSPNGGEYWAVGDHAPVTWASEGTVSNNLVLEWSPNGGGDYYVIQTGVPNTGSYTWTVPSDFPSTDNALFRITDGDRPAVLDTSNAVFHIIPLPTITITQPTGGQEFVLGDDTQIIWTYKGLSISNNLLIEISNDNFVTRQIIDQGLPNNGNYTWVLTGSTLTGATLKVRITDASRTEIKAMSSGYFRIRGGFTIVAPNGNENWVAKSTQTISWQTRGSVQRIKLEYSTSAVEPYTWNVIIASTSNEGSYTWTLPDTKSSSVRVRISDPDDPTTFDVTDTLFNIVYATVTFKVLDYDTLQHLQDVNFNEPASGWSDSGLSSPVTRTETYPYGTYTTFITKSNYIDNSVTWNPAKSGITPYVVTCYLENSASAQVTWEAILTYSFSPGNDTLNAVGSLQRKGKLIGTTAEERTDMGAATLTIYEPDGTTVRQTLTAVVPTTSGTYTFTYADTNFESGKVYPGILSITYRDRPYATSASIDVGSEILQYEFFNNTATKLAESVQTIETAVAGGTAQTRADIEASRVKLVSDIETSQAAVKAHVSSVLTATESNLSTKLTNAETVLISKVKEARDLTETAMKSQILNTENLVKSGETLTVRYRTHSGLNPVIDVYNAENSQEISKGAMVEIGSTGIYEYDVNFAQAWGKGDFTIICSESSKGVMDAATITVIKTNIEQVYNQVSAVLGSTAGISGLKQVADSMNSQFSIIETALSKVGKDLLKDVKDAASSAVALESVYNQVASVAKTVKQITGETGMNLEKLYKVSADKKNDIVYLKNKTQELKAAMELTKKMTDNIANKPITQTWYEYKK